MSVPTDDARADALSIECPTCAARPGEPCVLLDGTTLTGGVHFQRSGWRLT